MLKSYTGLTNLLRSYGVEPSQVAWNPIEMMCLGLNEPHNPVPYNRCRFDKALLQISYRDDSIVCEDEAQALYPKSLRSSQPDLIIANPKGITTITDQPLRYDDYRAGSRYAFDQCMGDKGWRNSRNWQLGMAR